MVATSEVIADSLRYMDEHGWVQHHSILAGRVCATGAVTFTCPSDEAYLAAIQTMADVLTQRGVVRALRVGPIGLVQDWNDEPGRTEDEVKALFKDAWALAVEREIGQDGTGTDLVLGA